LALDRRRGRKREIERHDAPIATRRVVLAAPRASATPLDISVELVARPIGCCSGRRGRCRRR
jgi:hypothetical protein